MVFGLYVTTFWALLLFGSNIINCDEISNEIQKFKSFSLDPIDGWSMISVVYRTLASRIRGFGFDSKSIFITAQIPWTYISITIEKIIGSSSNQAWKFITIKVRQHIFFHLYRVAFTFFYKIFLIFKDFGTAYFKSRPTGKPHNVCLFTFYFFNQMIRANKRKKMLLLVELNFLNIVMPEISLLVSLVNNKQHILHSKVFTIIYLFFKFIEYYVTFFVYSAQFPRKFLR